MNVRTRKLGGAFSKSAHGAVPVGLGASFPLSLTTHRPLGAHRPDGKVRIHYEPHQAFQVHPQCRQPAWTPHLRQAAVTRGADVVAANQRRQLAFDRRWATLTWACFINRSVSGTTLSGCNIYAKPPTGDFIITAILAPGLFSGLTGERGERY